MNPTKIDDQGWLQLAAVYELLSQLWTTELTLPQLQALDQGDMRQAIEQLGGYVPNEISQAVIDELAVDFCQLFIGPKGHLPPVQSVWTDGQFQSPTASSASRFMELLPDFCPRVNIPDHLGVQLQFMAELFQSAAVQPNAEAYTDIAQQFFDQHLSWTTKFLNHVLQAATTDFYRGLAQVTLLFLGTDNEKTDNGNIKE